MTDITHVKPTTKKKLRVLVTFSGGKDSHAALIWAVKESGFRKERIEAVFCDTGWEHESTYAKINEATQMIGVKLVTLRSEKYDDFVDMAAQKGRFPSTNARFCTDELKTKPMIDYVLSLQTDVLVIQGIRGGESKARAKMSRQCSYFRYYVEPYGYDKDGKPKRHTYRKKEVLDFREQYSDDVLRPVFDWSGQQVMQYILDAGHTPNELYYQGAKRVGCYPCIMAGHDEIKAIADNQPKYVERLKKAEQKVGCTFFPPDYIPVRYMTAKAPDTGQPLPTVDDVLRYVSRRKATGDLFYDNADRRCMSFYGICE